MANEFIARTGLVVLNGAKVTGSLGVSSDITASGNIRANTFFGNAQLTGSFTGSFVGDGSQLTGIATSLAFSGSTGSDIINLKTEALTFTGSNGITTTVTDNRVTFDLPTNTVSSSVQVQLNAITGTTFSNAAFLFPQDLTLGGDLQINGNDIRNSNGTNIITFAGTNNNDVRLWSNGALDILSGEIRNNGTTTFLMSGQNAYLLGRLRLGGNEIRNSADQPVIYLSGSNIRVLGSASADTGFVGNLTGSATLGLTSTGVNPIIFAINNTEQARIDSAGNVGIGTSTPGAKLHVQGNVSASSFTGSFSGNGAGITGVTATSLANALTIGSGLSGGSYNGSTPVTILVDTGSAHFITGSVSSSRLQGLFSSSAQVNHDATTNYVANQHIDHTTVSITAGSGLSGGGNISATRTLTLDTGSAHFITGSVSASRLFGLFSSSTQVDVRNTIGIATIATTGSNTFTGVQTISDGTNSTLPTNGALVVAGGVGITKDVNISGSLTVVGLLTAASMSTQYVTSSQLFVSDNKIVVQTNDLTRFGGLSVYDSGSTAATASIYWDSQNHKFIYENLAGVGYNSGMFIAGPANTGTLGNEVGLTVNRVPVATGDDHIDSRPQSSSIRVDFPSRLTHVEAGLVVTGSVTSSVGFSGDGSNLTGITPILSVTGSQSGQTTINLRTQGLIVSGTNGIAGIVSGQAITLSGSNATTTTKGVASFNSTNFTVAGGDVTSNAINFNGSNINLGGTHAFGLQNITPYGATTSDQVSFTGGAIIRAVLFTSASAVNIVGPVTNQVVATLATSSYDSAMFDYVLKDGTNYRAGTVMTVWNNNNGYEFTDTSTNDIGNTGQAILSTDTNGGNVRLKLTVTSGTWAVKTAIRML